MPVVFLATDMFGRIVSTALLAGAMSGLVVAVLQLTFVQPVLLHAELYETGMLVHFGPGSEPDAQQAWPGIDLIRDGLSALFVLLTYCGFALVMTAAMAFAEERGHAVGGPTGLLWGLAGFASVILAPAFSLAPEVPGVAAADVHARQLWWVATVVMTACAVALIAFGRGPQRLVIAGAIIAAPHIFGAPEPEIYFGPTPPELASLFATRVMGVAIVGWCLLGAAIGFLWQRSASAGHNPDNRISDEPAI